MRDRGKVMEEDVREERGVRGKAVKGEGWKEGKWAEG